jgi:hypothetical protein
MSHVEEWRCMHWNSIAMVKLICMLEKVWIWYAEGREKVSLVEVMELMITYIIHLENRISEKMIIIKLSLSYLLCLPLPLLLSLRSK